MALSCTLVHAQDAAWDEALLENNADPWESTNRKIFDFNEWVDGAVFKPVAKFYVAVTPTFIQVGVGNFFDNLGEIPTAGNDLLQGKFSRAASATGRFLVNTTIGLAGTIDIATNMGLEEHSEDFGQTLAVWGVGSGNYVVLPFLGPSTVRDTASLTVDWSTDVLSYTDDVSSRNSLRALDIIDTRAGLLTAEELIIGDRYVFIRDAFLQSREYEIVDGKVEKNDDFGDFDDFDSF